MNILITGGNGYIGSILTRELLHQNFNVTVLDLFDRNHTSLIDCANYKNFNPVKGDCRDKNLIKSLARDRKSVV